jgi:hypothetical protein
MSCFALANRLLQDSILGVLSENRSNPANVGFRTACPLS